VRAGVHGALRHCLSGLGPLRPDVLHCCSLPHYFSGPGPAITPIFFSNNQNCLDLKNRKTRLPDLQNLPNFARMRINSKGITFLLERSSNSQQNLNKKCRKPNKVEFGLNFKGVQSFKEKFHTFTKNLSCHDLQYREFRLTHSY
jgi:hypothetical protein